MGFLHDDLTRDKHINMKTKNIKLWLDETNKIDGDA